MKSLSFINVSNLIWHLVRSDWKGLSIISSASWLIMISMLSLFGWITGSSSVRHKFNFYCYFDFPYIRFFEILYDTFKCYLILFRYSSIDSVFIFSVTVHIQCNCYSKNYILLLVYNNILLLKTFFAFVIMLSYIFFTLFKPWTFDLCILWKKIFKIKSKSIILLKKALESTIFRIIQQKQYWSFMNYVNHDKIEI